MGKIPWSLLSVHQNKAFWTVMTIPRASWLRLYLGNWLKRWQREPKVQVSAGSDLWSVSSSLSASSPGFGRCAVAAAPLARVRSTPLCTRCPWSPGRVGSGCRWCSLLWGWAEGCRRSPGSPRRRCPQRHSPAPRVPSGGSQPGCWDTSCSWGSELCLRSVRRGGRICADLSGTELLSTCLRKDYNGRVTSASRRQGRRQGGAAGPPPFFFSCVLRHWMDAPMIAFARQLKPTSSLTVFQILVQVWILLNHVLWPDSIW